MKNQRIIFSLPPDHYRIVSEMAVATGVSRSALVGELVAEIVPGWERMSGLLVQAERLKGTKGIDDLGKDIKRAQAAIEGVAGLLLSSAGRAGEQLTLSGAEGMRRRKPKAAARAVAKRGGAAAAADAHPPSNRGVKKSLTV